MAKAAANFLAKNRALIIVIASGKVRLDCVAIIGEDFQMTLENRVVGDGPCCLTYRNAKIAFLFMNSQQSIHLVLLSQSRNF